MELWLNAGGNAAVWGIDQRKTLAVKLVLGLMLSMDSDHTIHTWDPKVIHFLKPIDTEFTPFVSIYGNMGSSSRRDCLPLGKLDVSGDRGDDDDAKPLPLFTLLAKALLQIAFGEPLKNLKIAYTWGRAFHDGWKMLRRMVDYYIINVTCGKEVDREKLPFLHAARNCLDFHTRYQVRAKSARSNHRMEIAWQLVFDDIIAQIDSNLNLGELVQLGTNALTKVEPMLVAGQKPVGGPSIVTVVSSTQTPSVTRTLTGEFTIRSAGTTAQPEVALFDGEDAVKDSM
jgi:hypothetical protein